MLPSPQLSPVHVSSPARVSAVLAQQWRRHTARLGPAPAHAPASGPTPGPARPRSARSGRGRRPRLQVRGGCGSAGLEPAATRSVKRARSTSAQDAAVSHALTSPSLSALGVLGVLHTSRGSAGRRSAAGPSAGGRKRCPSPWSSPAARAWVCVQWGERGRLWPRHHPLHSSVTQMRAWVPGDASPEQTASD